MSSTKIKEIEKIINGSSRRTREEYFKKYHIDTYNKIILFTNNISDIKFPFKIWHWVNDEPNYIFCECGERVSQNMNWKDGYKKYCSSKCSSNSDEIKDKKQKTSLEKWGVDHYSKTEEYSEKVKKTSLEKWGVDNFSKTEEYLKKSKETYLRKWGVDNFTKTDEYIKKTIKTSLEKWGVEWPVKSQIIKDKISKTNLERWNSKHIFSNNEFRIDNFKIAKDIYYIGFELGKNIFNCDCGEQHTFEISTDDYYGRKSSNNKLCTVCNPISSKSSYKEIEVSNFIKSIYDGEVINSWRDGRIEIDIYLPDLNIGFEFNGIWWHSDKYKDKWYHKNKIKFFKEKGIRIIYIWEDDWIYKKDIIMSQIRNWINLTKKRIFARKCSISIIDSKSSNNFLKNNHIQGKDKSILKIGLIYENEIISLMTFNKSEGRKKMNESEWNLSRFCNKINTNVVGGASKLLKYFVENYDPTRIISYADIDWSDGKLYKTIGFNLISESNPDYKYVIKNTRRNKAGFKKSNLKTELTESEFMKDIPKVWDSGKMKFEMILNKKTHL
jgi:hypothetical protein